MEYLAVDETNLVLIDQLDLENMLASKKKRDYNMKLPRELAIGFYRIGDLLVSGWSPFTVLWYISYQAFPLRAM